MKWPAVCFLFLLLVFHAEISPAQFYTTGEPPASIRWKQIKTPHFRIVFPADIFAEAGELATKLENNRMLTESSLNHQPKPISVLLHNATVLSNGYVTLAPRRMELVTTPPRDSYAQDWISQLTLHEYRHTVQLDKLNQGFTRALSLITGEIANGVVASMIPSWFYEGDAVVNETRFSGAGRGRTPSFEMPLRAIIMQNPGFFSYDKAVFGSYKDFVPDQYQYGYHLVSYANARYGESLWSGALDYSGRYPFFIWPLAFYLKRHQGIYKSGLYRQTMDSIKYQYNKQKDSITYSKYSIINPGKGRSYTHYKLPLQSANGSVIALKTGLDDIDRFVIIDSLGREKILHTPGYTPGLKADMNEHCLVWDEIVPDPRWGKRDFSIIRLLDLATGKCKILTRRSRYFSPDFSPDGKIIAVTETDVRNENFISLLDAFTGELIQKIPSPGNKALQLPEWVTDAEIAVVTVGESGKQLEIVDLRSDKWKVVLPGTDFDISEPVSYGAYLLFRSSYDGVENIYAIHKSTRETFRVTFSLYGAYHPSVSPDSSNLLFSEYSVTGFNIVSVSTDTALWKKITLPHAPSGIWLKNEMVHRNNPGNTDSTKKSYDAEKYNKVAHLLHVHSWVPFYTSLADFTGNIRDFPVDLGIMIFSQNLLSTFISSVGYRYANGFHAIIPTFTWQGWYPVIEYSGQYGGPVQAISLPEGISLPDNSTPYHELTIRTYIPLVYNRGGYTTYLVPRVEYERSNTWYYASDMLQHGIDYLHFRFNLNHYLRRSHRDIYPRWGQYLSLAYTQTPADNNQFGSMYSAEAGLFLPGLFLHHHLYLNGGYQRQYTEKYFISINRIDFPRGYASGLSKEFGSLAVNYSFPLLYPDLSLGPVLYLKRLRMNLFHDWSYGSSIIEKTASGTERYTGSYRSYGTEILADLHLIRMIFPITAGVRLGYIPGRKEVFSELMLSIQTGIF